MKRLTKSIKAAWRQIDLYRHWRGMGFGRRTAWNKAKSAFPNVRR